MLSSDFGSRPPVRLDEFEFSDEIEAELAHMEAQAQQQKNEDGAAAAIVGNNVGGMQEEDDHVSVSHIDVSSSNRFNSLSSDDSRREALLLRQQSTNNPAAAHAYAESHFSRPQPAAVPAAILTHQRMSSNPLSAAAAAASSFLPAAFLSPSSSTPNSAASASSLGYGTPATPAPAAVGFAALSSSSSSNGGSGTSAEHNNFYDDDANYFNLGGSSFPLLPHSSLYEAEMTDTPGSIGGIGPEKAFTPSGRVHAQHFTSILNQPTSFLRDNATRAVSVSTAYLPSLASLWTFTLGVEPPQAVKAASEDIASFAEEGAADPGPFVLKPIPGLDDKDLDMSLVLSYTQQLKDKMASYRRNHPDSTIAYKTGEATRMLKEKTKGHYAKSAAGMTPAVYRTTLEDELLQLDAQLESKSQSDESADDVESLLALNNDLHECYRLIPPLYFEQNCTLGQQDFWQDTAQLDYLKTSSQTLRDTYNSLYVSDKQQSNVNPYASFKSLTSYHHSPFFRLPSLEEQTRVAKLAHRIAESRNNFMREFNDDAVTQFQNVLSVYLDRVENNLLQQISLKSWIFFDALKNINAISTEINECLASIHTIRDNIKELQNNLTNAGLGVLAQKRSIGHTLKLIHLLELMASVSKTSPTVQLLLSTGDFSSALNLIQQTRVLLNGELKDVKALKSIHVKLNQHEILIQQMMQMEFVGLSIRGGNFYFVNDSATTNKDGTIDVTHAGKLKKSFIAMNRVLAEDEEDRLVPLVSHLLELNSFSTVFESYTNQLQSILKQRLMDLVYELLNRVQDDKDTTDAEATSTPPESTASTSAASQSTSEPTTSDEEVEEEDESNVSEKDKVAAISLLSDTQATGTEAEKDGATVLLPTVASTIAGADSMNSAVANEPSTTSAAVAAPATAATVDSNTVLLGGHKYGERKQAAVAMPVNATNNSSHATPAAAPPAVVSAATSQHSVSPPVPSPSPAALATSAQSASVTSRFSSLQHDQFLALLKPMFQSLMDLIVRASSIRDLAMACVQSNTSLSTDAKESLLSNLNEQLAKLLEYVHEKIGKILQTRAGVHASLSLAEFREYLDTILQFLQEGEKITSRTFYGLRAKLLSQAKSFLVVFHAKMMQKLSSSLELEKWTRVDVPNEFQLLLDSHFQSPKQQEKTTTTSGTAEKLTDKVSSASNGTDTQTVDPFADPSHAAGTPNASSASSKAPLPTWQSKSWSEVDETDSTTKQPPSGASSSTAPAQNPALKTADSTGAAKTASSDLRRVLFVPRESTLKGVPSLASGANIGFMKFPVVQSLLVLLEIVGEYIECSSQLQAVGSDILNRLVELLQMFNSRSCQLVLGAGAMHLSGLKSVS